jgi:hypothetical protein
MAHDKKKAMDIFTGLQYEIGDHIVKILMFEDEYLRNHWFNELSAWVGKLDRIKLKNGKKLNADIIYNILWTEPYDNGLADFVKKVVKPISVQYSKYERVDCPDLLIFEKLESILHDLSYDLSNDKFVDIKVYFNGQ